jgi:hypothetical protein
MADSWNVVRPAKDDDVDPEKDTDPSELDPVGMGDLSEIESTVESCFKEMHNASLQKYDADKADRTAALFLITQMRLSSLIEDVEMKAKNAKNEITRIEAEKYFEYKTNNSDKKITENMLLNYIAKDSDIIKTKKECVQYETNYKKWTYILGTLKDGHIYFRNLGKNKNWSE